MKISLPIILILLFGLFTKGTSAQVRFETYINFVDNNGHNIYPIPKVVIRHTDSASHPSSPILNFMGKANRPWGYLDSFIVDTSQFDSAFTINYYYCGQWYSQDIIYPIDHPIYATRRLNLTIQTLCSRSCNAEFYISDQYLHYYNQYYFYAGQTGGALQHEWDMGNGKTYTSPNVSYVEYDTVGSVTIKHIVRDTIAGCHDSSFQTINFPADCDANFYHQNTGGSSYRFIPARKSLSYNNLWYVDGVLVDSTVEFNHTFTNNGYHTIKHILSYGSVCSDTTERIINTSSQPCSIQILTYKNYSQVTFVPQDTTISYRYIFGDGDTLIQKGVVIHHYPPAVGQYVITVSDLQSICRDFNQTITISNPCNPAFVWNSDSSFKITFSRLQTSALTSRFIFSTGDTVYANSGSYLVNSPGPHWIKHQMITSQGQISCQTYKSFYVSACGIIATHQQVFLIRGLIKFNNTYLTDYDSLRVYLIYHDSSAGTLTAIDSINLYSGVDTPVFSIEIPCDTMGEYLIKAALLPNSKYYSNYLPTYSENSLTWSNAKYCYPKQFINLNFQAGTNPGGPGFIGGQISKGANKALTPLSGIQVNLFNEQEEPVAYTYSDADGMYSFSGLAYGKYKVIVEVPGRVSSFYWVNLDANHPESKEKNFEVNSTYVSLLNSILPELKIVSKIYPNPVDQKLFIDWSEISGEDITIQVMTMDGKVLHTHIRKSGESGPTEISVEGLPQGIYLLILQSDRGMSSYQIQKK